MPLRRRITITDSAIRMSPKRGQRGTLARFILRNQGTKPHTFDSLLSIKGFKGLGGPDKAFVRHDAQWNADPVGSGQFVTDCDWYSVKAPSGVTRPILFAFFSANQMLPSGPIVIPWRPAFAVGTGDSETTPIEALAGAGKPIARVVVIPTTTIARPRAPLSRTDQISAAAMVREH